MPNSAQDGRTFPRSHGGQGWRWMLVLAWTLLGLGVWAPGAVHAEPVVVLALGEEPNGALAFASSLVQLWARMDDPSPHRLALSILPNPVDRLRAVQKERAQFAIVDAFTALEQVPRLEQVTAMTALWPVVLHPVTRASPQLEITLPLAQETWVFSGGEYALQYLRERQRLLSPNTPGNPGKAVFAELPEKLKLGGPRLLLVPAPFPAQEIGAALEQGWELTPLASAVVQNLKSASNSVVTALLPKGVYPRQTRVLELPAAYVFLVGRADLSPLLVRKMLESVFGRRQAKGIGNPLFAALEENVSAVYASQLTFHPEAAAMLNLPKPKP